MKIMAPLNPLYSVRRLVDSGADGFYFGYIPECWINTYGNGYFINRRGHVKAANFTDDNIEFIIGECQDLDIPLYCTFNNHQYTQDELNLLYKTISYLKSKKINGVIASDTNILRYCRHIGVTTILSTCATNYNKFSNKFFKELGVNRIIFPRDITVDEMASIIQDIPDLEWEAFIYNSACRFSESVCLSNHGLYGNICKRLRLSAQISIKNGCKTPIVDCYYNKPIGSCGLCSIYRMNKIGITWLKIVERTLPYEAIVSSCKKVRSAIQLMQNVRSEEQFNSIIQRQESCTPGVLCYYK